MMTAVHPALNLFFRPVVSQIFFLGLASVTCQAIAQVDNAVGTKLPPRTAEYAPQQVFLENADVDVASKLVSSSQRIVPVATSAAMLAPVPALLPTASDPFDRATQSLLIQAIQNLDAARLPNLESTRQELLAAIANLEKFLDLTSERGQAWSKFLGLEVLKAELAKDQPDWTVLNELHMNMRQNYLGLELAPYVRVREGIDRMVQALKFGYNPEKTVGDLKGGMEALLSSLDLPAEGAQTERAREIGLITNYLHASGQVPEIVHQIHRLYSTPNIQVTARESLLNRLLMRPVAEPSPVNECLLGTRVIGEACLSGQVSIDVLPMRNAVALNLNLSAMMTSNNRGYNRGVVLLSTGTSPVYASKYVLATPQGVSSSPAVVSTNLQTNITDIIHKRKIVRRIAKRKAAQQQPIAQAIAQGRLQTRVQTRYDQQVNEQLAEANARLASFRSQPIPELPRLGVEKPSLSIYSTNDSVHGHALQAAVYQLSASKPCGFPKPASSDVIVEAHQSAAVNALDIVVGGRTIRNSNLDEYAMQILGKVPEDVMEEARGEPWSITMATYRPVEIEFDDNDVKISLRIAQLARGNQQLDYGAIVTARYHPSFFDGVLTLQRVGDVDIAFARLTRGIRAVTLSSFFRVKFNEVFKERIVTERIDLTKVFPNAPKLAVNALTINDGWLQLGLR